MFSEKIKRILNDKHLSPSRFADEIGVPRSSISHILSGRNKPSLDMVQKILRRFPELGTDWVLTESLSSVPSSALTEEASKSRSTGPHSVGPVPTRNAAHRNNAAERHSAPYREVPPPSQAVGSVGPPAPIPPVREREIEKILVFYSDKTFAEYRPS